MLSKSTSISFLLFALHWLHYFGQGHAGSRADPLCLPGGRLSHRQSRETQIARIAQIVQIIACCSDCNHVTRMCACFFAVSIFRVCNGYKFIFDTSETRDHDERKLSRRSNLRRRVGKRNSRNILVDRRIAYCGISSA